MSLPSCSHCSLPVPKGLIVPADEHQFCCHGCRTAYDIIHSCGLDAYYRVREQTSDGARPAVSTGAAYGEFDDPTFRGLYCRPAPDGLSTTELYLQNVHCAACVWLVERLPVIVPGVVEARLDFRRGLVRILWDDAGTPLSAIGRALDSLGYPPHRAQNTTARARRRHEDRRFLILLAVAGACAGNIMLLAMALYSGLFDTLEPQYREFFRWLSMLITGVSLAWPGSVFFRGAWAAIRTRTVHLDIPIAVGLGAGGVWGALNTIRGTGEIYFDSLSVLVFALLIGRWVQHRQQRWAGDAVELLFSLTPTSARRVEDGAVREVPIEALQPGDVVQVRAGDSIPADGLVTGGESRIDQSLLTGESRPVAVRPLDAVSAGAVNLGAQILVRVEAAGEATRVGRLMRMVEECAARRAPIVRLADRIAGYFVACMLGLATLTLGLWLWLAPDDPSRAMDNAVALLIVTCPCALGLATPLAVTVAIGRAARRGMLVKGGDALERLARPGTIYLDKTGTITEGRMALVRWHGPEWAKPLAAAVEAQSSHPIARAFTAALGDSPTPATDVAQTLGAGIEGCAGHRRVVIGAPAFVRAKAAAPDWLDAAERELIDCALTPVLIAIEGEITAAAGLGDPIRPDARDAVDALRAAGWRVGILSGDHPQVAAAVGRALGIDPTDVRGGMTPEDKLAAVTAASSPHHGGPVVMVGDGVNDAAALAAATVGIAVHGGAEASLAAADIYLSRPGLAPIVELATASRRTVRAIRRNLGASLAYNIFAASLAITGVINPLIAAILMPASSLTVLTLSFKARTFGGR